MPWVAPPTFVDGETLSALKLNQLRDAVAFVNAVGAAPAPVFAALSGTITVWCPRHRHRFLNVLCQAAGCDEVNVWRNGVKVFYDNDPEDGTWYLRQGGTGVLDLDAVGLTYGQPYALTIELKNGSGGSSALLAVFESSVAY